MTKSELKLTPFGKLTPEEQGALLLGEHNGETVQIYSGPSRSWQVTSKPEWLDGQPYRIKPKVKMQDEYWVVFSFLGKPLYLHTCDPSYLAKTHGYVLHHPPSEN